MAPASILAFFTSGRYFLLFFRLFSLFTFFEIFPTIGDSVIIKYPGECTNTSP